MIEAVTFDYWGTLYYESPDADEREARRVEYARSFLMGLGHDVSAEVLRVGQEVLGRQMAHHRLSTHRGLNAEDTGSMLAEIVGVRLAGGEARRLGELLSAAGREMPPTLAAGAADVLRALHGRVKLAVISDTGVTLSHDMYAVMEADGIAGLFDHFTFSDQTGTTKPEQRQFSHTLYRLGCPPSAAVHVGDFESADIAGAKAIGMRAIRIRNHWDDPATTADAAVETISEVLPVLQAWGLAV
ncbi:MAG TPA: HAD family hydrolase [Phycisphaerae bacterium]|nr:HAD family hydrolase [Phycisphaerae bacterium]